MNDSADRRFALAVAWARVLPPAGLEEAIRARAARGEEDLPLADWLVREGLLTRERRDELLAAQPPADAPSQVVSDSATSPSHAAPDTGVARTLPSAGDAVPAQIGRLGRYELREELGRGGMGVVFRAFDLELQREVALKTLLLGDQQNPEMVERLLREARTAATLSHPGIVPIHDVGVIDRTPYFAMAFVRGRTLDRALRERSLPGIRERVGVVARVADAVAHAHDRQVIHRDLKPSNVLIDDDGGVHVMDFGLARRLDEAGKLTVSGQMIGTPQYMPPEQIEGERDRVGPASDVYALGAVLYEALAGHPPFQGGTVAEVVGKSLSRDPEPLRSLDPRIHPDLETICAKALDKDPRRRYPTARPFAQELERYLNGEPIEARPLTWRMRVVRRMARQKLLTACAAAALLAVSWAAFAVRSKAELERTQAELRAKVRQTLRDQAGLFLDAALSLRRAGAVADKAERDYLPRLEGVVVEADRVDPGRAEPHVALGRLYRAVMRWDEAAASQDRALAAEPSHAVARYERAVVTARLLAQRVQELREQAMRQARRASAVTGEADVPAPPSTETLTRSDPRASALRDRLLVDLTALDESGKQPGLSGAHLDCAHGLARAYSAGSDADRDAARALLEGAVQADPTLEEAYEALATLAESVGDWERAIEVYDSGVRVDRGYVPFWIGRGDARATLALWNRTRGRDPGSLHALAVEDLSRAVELQPGKPEAWVRRGSTRMDWALDGVEAGTDPVRLLEEAIADFSRALELSPDHAEALHFRAGARTNLGRHKMDRAGDCLADFEAADRDFSRALDLAPQDVETLLWRGTMRTSHAHAREQRGEDPTALYEGAVADFGKAIELDARSAQCRASRGGVRSNWATWCYLHGRDPEPLFRAAEQDFHAALELDPDASETWVSIALLHTTWGTWLRARGEAPEPRYELALAEFSRSLDRNPRSSEAWMRRAGVHMNWGVTLMSRGEDPEEHFQAAVDDFTRSLALNPRQLDSWMWRGGLRTNWGAWAMDHGGDPDAHFSAAIDDYARALEINPESAEGWMMRGGVWTNRGVWRMSRDLDPSEALGNGVEDFDRAIRLNPNWVEGWMQRGVAHTNLGRWEARHGRDPVPAFRAAAEDYGRAVAVNPQSAEGWSNRGEVRLNWADWLRERDEDAETLLTEAQEDFTRALGCNPSFVDAWTQRGAIHHVRGRYAEAVSDYEAALRIQPGLAGDLADRLADARVRLRHGDTLIPALKRLRTADEAVSEGRYADARAPLEDGLRVCEELHGTLSAEERARFLPDEYLQHARYNLACVLSLASVGKDGPKAEPRPIALEQAAALRDGAFACLSRMAAAGGGSASDLEQDADLEPLRSDPRWGEVVGKMR